MIASFANKHSEMIAKGDFVKRFAGIARQAQRKMRYLEAAAKLSDLAIPPGNHLEALRDDRAGQHSIRVNDQYRICFTWKGNNAHEVEIIDYH